MASKKAEDTEKALEVYRCVPEEGVDPEIGVSLNFARKRRGKGTGRKFDYSLRSALNLPKGQISERKEQVGNIIDLFDKFAVETG